jgi:predicted  nucleic acid-binding Zn-ribbon protein
MEKKITEEQLTKIQEQQTELNAVLHEVGYLETQQHGLMHKFASINQAVEEFKTELEKEYGAININVEDGTYTEIKKEETVENV